MQRWYKKITDLNLIQIGNQEHINCDKVEVCRYEIRHKKDECHNVVCDIGLFLQPIWQVGDTKKLC